MVLDNRSWMHPFDDQGRRRDYADIPKAVTDLVDDPFRSLAGELRLAGGYAKDTTPSANFSGRISLRRRMKRQNVEKDFRRRFGGGLEIGQGERTPITFRAGVAPPPTIERLAALPLDEADAILDW